jgi:hypothetical protein
MVATTFRNPKGQTRERFVLEETNVQRIRGAERIGAQRPLNLWVPGRDFEDPSNDLVDTSLAEDSIEWLKDVAGWELDPWQEFVLAESLNLNPMSGKYMAREVGLVVPRQQGKTFIVEARELVGALLLGEKTIIHSSHLFKTSFESFLRLSARISSVPHLEKLVLKRRSSNDNVAIEFRNGSRIMYLARGASDPGRGLSGDLIILDEGFALKQEEIATIMPTLAARTNPQMWYTSSTGKDDSEVLEKLRDRGLSHTEKRLAYFDWSAHPGCDLDEVDEWYLANPALGIRLEEEFIATERQAMADKQFARERLGLWADNSLRDVIEREKWDACKREDSVIVGDYCVGIDISPDHAFGSVSVSGVSDTGKRHVEIIAVGRGTGGWILDTVAKLLTSQRAPRAVAVQGGAASGTLIPALQEMGVEVIAFGGQDIVTATGELYNRVEDQSLSHLGDELFITALAGASKYNIGKLGVGPEAESKGWGWSRRDTTIDITPIVAATYALRCMSKKLAEDAQEEKPSYLGKPKGGRIW